MMRLKFWAGRLLRPWYFYSNKKMLKKLQKNKNIILLTVLFCSIFGLLLGVRPVFAEANPVMTGIATVIGWIAFLISYVIGYVATVVIDVLIWVAQFNNIIGVAAVNQGWVIVRDLCNMFFILILLVIAFATILRQENYSAKKLLPKLLIMAVLINFSKTICGLIIDFSQVIMLTFVNGFASTGAGHFVQMFQMNKYFSMSEVSDQAFEGGSGLAVAAGIIMGVIAMIVTVITLLVMLAVLVMRIIMLWVYTILSPIAFLAAAFPAGQKYSSQWWSEFSKQVVVGPVLAFFIWLALLTAGTSSTDLGTKVELSSSGISVAGQSVKSPNALFNTVNFQSYIITLALLIGGLMVTQQLGGMAGSLAGSAIGKIKTAGLGAARGATFGLGAWGARKFAKTKYGFQINPFEIGRGIKESFEEKKLHDLQAGRTRGKELLEKGGIRGVLGGLGAGPDWADNYISGVANWKGFAGIAKNLTHGTGWRKKRNKELAGKEEELNKYKDYYGSQAEKDKDIKKQQTKKSLLNEQMIILNTQYDEAKDKKEQDAIEESRVKVRGGIKKIEDEEATINLRGIDAEKGAKKEALQKDIKGIKDELTKYMAPRGFKGRAASQALVNEEMKKISDIQNDELLISYLKDAMNKKDKYRVMAIAKKMTADGNDNEWLNALDYDSNAIGLTKFVEEELIKKMGINEQEALAFQDDISYSAERVNHWETAKTVGVGADGRLQSLAKYDSKTGKWDDSRHAQAAFAEIMKLDPQVIARNLNRLAYGGERMRADGSGRDFMISTLGLMLTKALGDSADFVDKHGGRFNINTSQNLSTPETIKVMMEAGIKPDFIQMAVKKGISKEGIRLDPENVWKIIDEVAKKLRDELYKKDAENAQKIIS